MIPLSFRLWIGKWVFGVVGELSTGIRTGKRRMVKLNCAAPEVEALRYVADKTTIPVPKIHQVHQLNGKLAIEMEYFPACQTLEMCWKDLTDDQKRSIVSEISGFVQQLRDLIRTNRRRISSTEGGQCRDVRIGTVALCGPFQDTAAFHSCLRGGIPLEQTESVFGEKVLRVHERDYESKYTHGDLGAQNILIRNGRIVAVLNWECAGWYPEYWEYTKAHYNFIYCPRLYDMLVQTIPRYDEELQAERELWKVFDQPMDQDGSDTVPAQL